MNHANMLGQIAIAIIEDGQDINAYQVEEMCRALPCGTTDCDTCPFDSIHNFNQFKEDYNNANS